jgi:allophanate hydrolase subunit 1
MIETTVQQSTTVIDTENLIRQANLTSSTKTIMVIIADDVTPNETLETLMKKIRHRHDVIWVSIADINPVSIPKKYDVLDVADIINIPDGLRADAQLVQKMYEDEVSRKLHLQDFLKGLRISSALISSSDEILPSMITLLKRRESEQRNRI